MADPSGQPPPVVLNRQWPDSGGGDVVARPDGAPWTRVCTEREETQKWFFRSDSYKAMRLQVAHLKSKEIEEKRFMEGVCLYLMG